MDLMTEMDKSFGQKENIIKDNIFGDEI